MSEDTSLGDKDTIDRTQVFAVYNVYRLVIGSVLFALTLSDTGSGLLSDDIALQTTGAGIFVILPQGKTNLRTRETEMRSVHLNSRDPELFWQRERNVFGLAL